LYLITYIFNIQFIIYQYIKNLSKNLHYKNKIEKMTTAHRPTFDPARGGTGKNEGDLSKLSQQYSSRDMPSHMSLKYRQKGQAHPDEVNAKVSNEKPRQNKNKAYFLKNYRREIEEKEQSTTGKDRRSRDSRESIGSLGSGPSSKRQK
jgi:protein CWC15